MSDDYVQAAAFAIGVALILGVIVGIIIAVILYVRGGQTGPPFPSTPCACIAVRSSGG